MVNYIANKFLKKTDGPSQAVTDFDQQKNEEEEALQKLKELRRKQQQ